MTRAMRAIYKGGYANTQPDPATPFPAEPLIISLRFSGRIRSFQADPGDGRVRTPASFFSREIISAFGKFAVFPAESRRETPRNRSAAADLLGEPLSTRAQHKTLRWKHFTPFAGGQNFLKRGCAARALLQPCQSRGTRARAMRADHQVVHVTTDTWRCRRADRLKCMY